MSDAHSGSSNYAVSNVSVRDSCPDWIQRIQTRSVCDLTFLLEGCSSRLWQSKKSCRSARLNFLSYMKILSVPLGLLINFHEKKVTDGVTRLILPARSKSVKDQVPPLSLLAPVESVLFRIAGVLRRRRFLAGREKRRHHKPDSPIGSSARAIGVNLSAQGKAHRQLADPHQLANEDIHGNSPLMLSPIVS
jgi:hypothetical protein